MSGESLSRAELELTEEQRAFSSFIIDSLGYSATDADASITYRGMTAPLRDGLGMCMDHIFEAGWDETQIRLFADTLLATARAGQNNAT